MNNKQEIDLAIIVALAKNLAIKYGSVGISDIKENANKNGVDITLTDGTIYNLEFDNMMLRTTYDSNNSGSVDNSEKLNNELPSYYLTSSNINYDNTTSKIAATNVKKCNR